MSTSNIPSVVRAGDSEALEEAISNWLIDYLADLFSVARDEIDCSMTFECYGLDSASALGLSGALGNWLGCAIEPTIAYDYPSIDELCRALASFPEVLAASAKGAAKQGA